ncbi:hypothetical protein JVU11DRAFT_6943 [Chiua virens]|nr:hypothetical protein JVU11DRAFT_6943 [Chiua virens]
MAPVTNTCVIFKEVLQGIDDATRAPILGTYLPGQTTAFVDNQTIDVDNVPLDGGILLKTLVLSLELYVLAKMRSGLVAAADTYKDGDTIQSFGVGVVVRTENPAFKIGDHLFGVYPFAEYSVQSNTESYGKIDNKHNLPWNAFVGIAGMPGQTAFTGWNEYARAKKGEVAFVTSGAGAVGSLVIQLAKRDGMKVIASAGTDDKVQFLKELGADVAFNYKTTKTAEVLAEEGPIDVYWDNVGGETLEAALNAAARYA